MKAAIYNPYLDTLGGGERYTMAFAQVLVKKSYRVDVQWNEAAIGRKLEERFGIKLKEINFVKDVKRGDGYDICFWVSDGSIPLLRARNNILHFQIPFKNVDGKSLLNRMKMYRVKSVVCNSQFTKKIVDREYGIKSHVVYPPVDVVKIKPKRKENIILSVGRFSQLTQAKRQDVLISAFKRIYDSGFNDWEIILAGGVDVGVDDYVNRLRKKSKGYPIKLMESPDFKEIIELYGKAKIFWSASGFEINEEKEPKKVEHFGITVVEAMAAKAVPVIFSAGGHKEIVADMENGILWSTTRQLIAETKKLMSDKKLLRKLSLQANSDSRKYSYGEFEKKVTAII